MHVHLRKAPLLLLLVSASVLVAWASGRQERAADMRAAHGEVTRWLAGTAEEEPRHVLDGALKVLLADDAGLERLRVLDADHDILALHESRNAVYYIHPRRNAPGHSCIATVAMDPDEGAPFTGHAGLPGFLELEALAVDGEVLVVRYRASSDAGDLMLLQHKGLEAGEVNECEVALDRLEGRMVTYDDLGFRPLIPG